MEYSGELSREHSPKKRPRHGFCRKNKRHRLYEIWRSMRQRCYYPKRKDYHAYGGRGIKVCDEWKNSFICFADWALNNGYSDTLTLDRINNDGDYCPENCRWATRREQDINRPNIMLVEYRGSIYTLVELGDMFSVAPSSLRWRLSRGFAVDDAIKESIANRKKPWSAEEYKKKCAERKNKAKRKTETV